MLNAMARAGTARTAAVMSTQRPHRIRLFVCMSCVMFSLMICAEVSANVPSTKPCRPRFASVRSRHKVGEGLRHRLAEALLEAACG